MKRVGFLLSALLLTGAACSLSPAGRAVNGAVNTGQQVGDIVSGASALAMKAAADRKLALTEARDLYVRAAASEQDLSAGPCLANPLQALPDWVVDIAHSPREAVDERAQNQCSAFRSGAAKHFVEFDPNGKFIRAE